MKFIWFLILTLMACGPKESTERNELSGNSSTNAGGHESENDEDDDAPVAPIVFSGAFLSCGLYDTNEEGKYTVKDGKVAIGCGYYPDEEKESKKKKVELSDVVISVSLKVAFDEEAIDPILIEQKKKEFLAADDSFHFKFDVEKGVIENSNRSQSIDASLSGLQSEAKADDGKIYIEIKKEKVAIGSNPKEGGEVDSSPQEVYKAVVDNNSNTGEATHSASFSF